MGNYQNFEIDFINKTLSLISQYEGFVHSQKFENQYNYTLLMNCFLGLIVMPKERSVTHLPNDRIISQLKVDMGLVESEISTKITTLRQLIIELRHSIAHFDFDIVSLNDDFLVDEIVFNDESEQFIARIKATEMLPFLRYYCSWLIKNIEENNS